MTIIANTQPIVNGRHWSGLQFNDETFGTIDTANGLLTIQHGQQTGQDDDYAGRIVGSVELSKAVALLKAYMAEEEDAETMALIERFEAQADARHDAVSSHFGHD